MSSRQLSHRLLIVISFKWIISHQLFFYFSWERFSFCYAPLWAVIYWTKERQKVLYSNIRSVLFDIMLISTAAGWRMLLALFVCFFFFDIESILLNNIVDIEHNTIQYYTYRAFTDGGLPISSIFLQWETKHYLFSFFLKVRDFFIVHCARLKWSNRFFEFSGNELFSDWFSTSSI